MARADDFRETLLAGGDVGRLLAASTVLHEGLGPIEQWTPALRTSVQMCLGAQFPMVIAWGADLHWIYNDAYSELLGGRHPDALGRPGAEVWPDAWPRVEGIMRACLDHGESRGIDQAGFVVERLGYPEEVFATCSFSPIRDGDGIGGVLTLVQEVTTQIVSTRRLEVLHRLGHLASGPERTAQSVCLDAAQVLDGATQDVPFSLLYLLDGPPGSTTAELVAWSGIGARPRPELRDVLAGSHADVWRFEEALEAGHLLLIDDPDHHLGVATGASRGVVMPLQLEGSRTTTFGFLVAGASPVRPLDQDYRGFFRLVAGHLAGSVAEVRALEHQRAQVVALAELDRSKSTFFSNMSHEFRTPLTLLLSPLRDALADQEQPLPPDQYERVELALRSAERMRRLVDGLLDFARLDAGRAEPSRQAVDLSQLTADIASVFRSAVERAGLELRLELEELPGPVELDPEMWEHIVTNLLSNALKYTFVGEIVVSLRQRDDEVVLEVTDTGIGIGEKDLDRVFERFHRVGGPEARVNEGSGIGLSLVRAYVEIHGGEVDVRSELGRGSTFRVCLPVTSRTGARTLDTGRAEDSQPGQADDATGQTVDGAEAVRVLVVDDNADMRDYLDRLLRRQFVVQTASDGIQALEAITEQAPDVVVSDVMMPNLDGFGLVREIRANPTIAHVPVVLLTARAGDSAVAEGLGLGADDYLVKPFKSDELVARIAIHARRGTSAPNPAAPAIPAPPAIDEPTSSSTIVVVEDEDANVRQLRRDERRLELELPRRHQSLRSMRQELRSFLEQGGMAADAIDEFVLAVNEAAANAIEHPREPSRAVVDLVCELTDDELTVTVQDYGTWRERQASMDRGRGSMFMANFADVTVTPQAEGTEVMLRRRLGRR